ncbi:MAG: MCE family protein [Nocardioides sp.]|uniref:MCE family protein n=1 Tax=Nocardioides sp. TaxID=35761 RepID=UPI0039E43051
MKPFRERNQVKIGAISIMAILLIMGLAFKADSLPLIGGGTTYYADFAEAGGLTSGDEVRIAGVRVGKVSSVELDGDKVKVAFKIKTDSEFGTKTGAAIKIKTLLGEMYLDLIPSGPGQLAKGQTIPVSRTQSPYDVVQAFSGLATTAGKIDTKQLSTALTTLADLTRNTPESFRKALNGVSRLSTKLAAKDQRINTLLKNLDRVTKTLDDRDQDIITLMKESSTLFEALVKRRQSIHNLLVSARQLSTELSALIDESSADLKPALTHLHSVVNVLNANEDNLDEELRLMAPFYRVFANVLGNGPWFDSYIQNLPPVPAVTQ